MTKRPREEATFLALPLDVWRLIIHRVMACPVYDGVCGGVTCVHRAGRTTTTFPAMRAVCRTFRHLTNAKLVEMTHHLGGMSTAAWNGASHPHAPGVLTPGDADMNVVANVMNRLPRLKGIAINKPCTTLYACVFSGYNEPWRTVRAIDSIVVRRARD